MAASLDPAAFDRNHPAAFYLPVDGKSDWEALADATLVAGHAGKRLPAHSQVLSLQSSVLRGLFADLSGGGSGSGGHEGDDGPCPGRKRKAAEIEGPMVLEAPFKGCSLFECCLFLRLCYRPGELKRCNLASVLGSLAGLLRLAHKLDAPQIQQAVCECMADELPSASLSEVLDWMAAADHCQLPELRLRCLGDVARRLASGPSGLAGALVDAELVAARCSKGVLVQLLGMMAAAGGEDIACSLPEPDAALAALQQAANPACFEWALESYSEHPSDEGQPVLSPWLIAAGREWRFVVYPGGDGAEGAGHLSVYPSCSQAGTRAHFGITLVDQLAETKSDHISKTDDPHNEPWQFDDPSASWWGWAAFVTHDQLQSRPGYLAGDRLVLRARVQVVP